MHVLRTGWDEIKDFLELRKHQVVGTGLGGTKP